jgi:uncharacterized protein
MSDLRPRLVQNPDAASPHAPAVVLDTNVVLDWLLFQDIRCASLGRLLLASRLQWHATASMRGELVSVLPRPQFQRWLPNCEHMLSTFDNLVRMCPEPPSIARSTASLRCRDPDDQKFIDLATAVGAQWLLSKDRALLALARPARALGVQVLTPAQWQRQTEAARSNG